MVLADIKVKANIYQNRVRIITSSMNPDSPSTTSCTCTEASEHRQFWTYNQNIETGQLSVEIPTIRSRLFHLTRLSKVINKKDNQKKVNISVLHQDVPIFHHHGQGIQL
jgi:hypothetical protein